MGKGKGGGQESWGLGGQLLVLFLHDGADGKNGEESYVQSKPRPAVSGYSSSITGKAQSIISICGLLVFVTLLVFALSTFDPVPSRRPHYGGIPRRWLSREEGSGGGGHSFALQGMGTLFRRGNRAMGELLVAHLAEDTRPDQLRWFLRALHRSRVPAKADLVLIFPRRLSSSMKTVIEEEDGHFAKLLASNSSSPAVGAARTEPNGQPVWGRSGGKEEEGGGPSWGSVVGFEAGELDPEDSLAGFVENPPIQLRRWACYRMLLGRVRRNFKHAMLVGVKDVLVTGDAFGRVRNRKTADAAWIADRAVVGGTRAVRRLSDAMLTEIVRVALQRKSRNALHDSQILAHLVKTSSVLNKKIQVVVTTEAIASNSVIPSSSSSHVRDILCSSAGDKSLYKDCSQP